MNTSAKVGLMAAMMVLALVAISGSASANVKDDFKLMVGGGAPYNHTCVGLVDANCTCDQYAGACTQGAACDEYVWGTCVIGAGGI